MIPIFPITCECLQGCKCVRVTGLHTDMLTVILSGNGTLGEFYLPSLAFLNFQIFLRFVCFTFLIKTKNVRSGGAVEGGGLVEITGPVCRSRAAEYRKHSESREEERGEAPCTDCPPASDLPCRMSGLTEGGQVNSGSKVLHSRGIRKLHGSGTCSAVRQRTRNTCCKTSAAAEKPREPCTQLSRPETWNLTS